MPDLFKIVTELIESTTKFVKISVTPRLNLRFLLSCNHSRNTTTNRIIFESRGLTPRYSR